MRSVGSDVPPDLRYGIFAEPRTYSAWIRFSSSSAQPRPDSKRDAHGMSIKVMDVQGEKVLPSERDETTQDFIVANSPVFFCRNASDDVVLASRMSEGRLLKFFFGADPRKWRVHEFVNMMVATQKKVVNPLHIRYWSQTPFALGPHAVKYSAQPNGRRRRRNPISGGGANRLEDAMARQLERGEASYISRELIPRYDLYLSFTGGPILQRIEHDFAAPKKLMHFYGLASAH